MKFINNIKSHPFTLLELLIVIAIISILMTVLLPALRKAKVLAKRTVCSGSMSQVNQTALYYADDYNNYLPALEEGGIYWYQKLWPYVYPDKLMPAFNGSGTDYDKTIFSCPEYSYDRSRYWVGGLGMNSYLPPHAGWAPTSPIPLAAIKQGSEKAFFADSDTFYLGTTQLLSFAGGTLLYFDRYRHLKGANITFCDGHVEYRGASDISNNITNLLSSAEDTF